MAELRLKQLRDQLRAMSDDDLRAEVERHRALLFDNRRKHAMRQLTDTAAIRASHRQIARALTLLREREIARQKEARKG